MHLLIDAGNTRIKWRAIDCASDARRAWSSVDAGGILALEEVSKLKKLWQGLNLHDAWIACVADEQIFTDLSATLRDMSETITIHRAVATSQQNGLLNGYLEPAQLGADRWIGAIGARALFPGRLLVIATLGTATTIDVIVPLASSLAPSPASPPDAAPQARFHGGVILPGIELMRRALRQGTARLPLASGLFKSLADNTDDAIVSGILHAQAGAIERVCRAAGTETGFPGEPLCLLGGGAAAEVAPLLSAPGFPAALRVEHDLVLRGLARFAGIAQ